MLRLAIYMYIYKSLPGADDVLSFTSTRAHSLAKTVKLSLIDTIGMSLVFKAIRKLDIKFSGVTSALLHGNRTKEELSLLNSQHVIKIEDSLLPVSFLQERTYKMYK